ncbi:thiol-disulfide oxidoreductase DCC family protein [Marivirga sp. S37H4]|uniref:Thiol-disulfide oxidoreductase DCC family protein n=1 Tax=Marivirga aurantiaca TaxID=2802615 RepID=A0A934X1W8_9BACT|nr:thiol-disulfide oxidoreductase DCC family protein [Marivirga aurantiaca]MBK6266795.1 thiol-disulfide oxidoreductase DCC family protein [Marivirga aurantiaca]
MSDKSIIFFDGVCNLCNGAVNFVIDRDPNAYFKLAPLQSEIAKQYLGEEKAEQLDSIVLFENGKLYQKSSAALRISRKLAGGWPLVYTFIIIPPFIRDFFYDIIARNRYKWFGKEDSCRLATPDIKERFLE